MQLLIQSSLATGAASSPGSVFELQIGAGYGWTLPIAGVKAYAFCALMIVAVVYVGTTLWGLSWSWPSLKRRGRF